MTSNNEAPVVLSLSELLAELTRRQIRLYVQDEKLRCQAPPEALSDELRAAINAHKYQLIQIVINHKQEPGQAIQIIPRSGQLPCSFAQQRLWFLHQFDPLSPQYNRPAAIHLTGLLDRNALQRAMDEIVRRHEALRTVFEEHDGEPFQVITPAAPVPLAVEDLSTMPVEQREAELHARILAETRRSFDLAHGPLVRVRLFVLARDSAGQSTKQVLLAVLHHIVFDGWSVGVLIDELAALYSAFHQEKPSPLPELKLQYADYASWQRERLQGDYLQEQIAFWREHLGVMPPVLDLPTDHPRPAVQSFRGASLSFSLSRTMVDAINAIARKSKVNAFTVWLAALQALLYRYAGQREIVIGTVIANRPQAALEQLIGFFANTLVLRGKVHGQLAFTELLLRDHQILLDAYAHQDLPFESLVEALSPPRDASRNPLFQVAIVLHNAPIAELRLPDLLIETVNVDLGATQFDLTLHLTEGESGMAGSWEYNPDLFDDTTIACLHGHFYQLIQWVITRPAARIAEILLLTAEERQRLYNWQLPTQWEIPVHDTLDARFATQVKARPDATALSFGAQTLSYAELNRRANRLAHCLCAQGAGPEVRVGISLPRGIDLLVAIIAILKTGAAYVPLDPEYPQRRLRFLIQDAGITLVVTDLDCLKCLPEGACHYVCMDIDAALIAAQPEIEPKRVVAPDTAAYVIYTSGTTGKPKGVVVTHRNVLRLFAATQSEFNFGPQDVWTLFHSYAFDFSVWEIWGALLYGGRLVVIELDTARTPEIFYGLLANEGVTVLNQTPSSFYALAAADTGNESQQSLALRLVIFGGEALDPTRIKAWFTRHGDAKPQLVNMYGITETTIHVTLHRLRVQDSEHPASSIGRPLKDLCCLILDRDGNPVPVSIAGELYVGGGGVARGYLNRPDLTAERFLPTNTLTNHRLYRTGDRARYLPDGSLEYLGRVDEQVKIRGFRIEPGEVQAQLLRLPSIEQAIVIVHENRLGERVLVAYVVAPADGFNAHALKAELRRSLPEYMIPSHIMRIDALPLTANGKLDRRSLPAPNEIDVSARTYVAPESEIEIVVADIWRSVLHLQRVSVGDSFFDLGGHSLLATQLISRLRPAFEIDLPLRMIFEAPTVRAQASYIELRLIEAIEAEGNAESPQRRIA